jgi:RNA polymerase sigma-70 factor (ECF subfamily)
MEDYGSLQASDFGAKQVGLRVDRPETDVAARVRDLVDRHYDFVWRTLQYLGMAEADADDGAQQVMCVAARRIADIEQGAEASFLFSTAVHVASEGRRALRRRPRASEVDLDALAAEAPSADELLDQQRARRVLHEVLEAIPEDLRLVFVLFELEELTMPTIAGMLSIPVGTVASRLRRARETFQAIVKRMHAASRGRGGQR